MQLLSIITINYNNLAGLQKTMQSVFEQSFSDYEYIIIDGGSTDGSKEYIEQYKNRLAYWVSEKDGGIYEALNKGSKIAKGEYLHHLNSGDSYYDNNVLKRLFSTSWAEDFIYGNQNLPGYFLKTYPPKLTLDFFMKDAVPHQATIIKKSFFEHAGPFSTSYRMGGDYKFFLEAVYLHQCTYAYSGITMIHFDMHGVSTLQANDLRNEFTAIQKESIPNTLEEFYLLSVYKHELDLLLNSKWVKFGAKIKGFLTRK